jgi:hypothetical protein
MGTPVLKFVAVHRAIKRDPHAREYMDQVLAPVEATELDTLKMFNVHDAAKAAVVKARR